MPVPEAITYRDLLLRAAPLILANMAGPLLGLADTAIIGNFGATADLGAIAFGALIFSLAYWSFGFLRMSTTGFAARAAGAGDAPEIRAILGRALLLASALGVFLLLLQAPTAWLAFALLDGSAGVEAAAREYFRIRIWGAPAALAVFALSGLLVGLGRGRLLLFLQLFLNGLNIALDLLFAGWLQMGVAGIALGTLLAEWSTLAFGALLLWRELAPGKPPAEAFWPRARVFDRQALGRAFSANGDILLRTLTLVLALAFFTNESARFGDASLAANHILLQFVAFAAFFLDGYAYVVESLAGKAAGAGRRDLFDSAVRKSTVIAAATSALLALLLALVGTVFIHWLTDIAEVRLLAGELLPYAALYVLLCFAAFQLDGIFIGVARTRQLRNAALAAGAVFLLAWWLLGGRFSVAGLWRAMIVFVVARALALLCCFPGLRASIAHSPVSRGE